MKTSRYKLITILLLLSTLAMSSCALPGGGPGPRASTAESTMTAIPLPTRAPTQVAAQVEQTASPTPISPTATRPVVEPTSTSTPSAEPTSTRPAVATPTATSPEPSETPTPTARPKTPRPRPTSTPEFSGKLVFQTTIGGDFYTINADGSGLRRITDGVDPVWSPDGTQIAFTRWREPRGVWVVDADGANERRVFDWSEARWPSWSPAGTGQAQILFSRQHGGRLEGAERCFWGFCFDIPASPHWRLGVVQVDDGRFYEPPSALVSLTPDWSSNGIVYDGEQGLTVQTLDGEVSFQITSDGRDTGPVWSPGGTRIAFTRRQHDHWEVYLVDADGGNLTRLTDTPQRPDGGPGNSAAPAWSPDGKHLAFLTDRSGAWQLWVVRASGGKAKPLFDTELDGLTLEYSSVSERAISWTE